MRPIRICIYTCIPEKEQFARKRYPAQDRLKGAINDAAQRLRSGLTGELHFDPYSYMVAHGLGDNSNRGDIAIRLAIRSQLQDAFLGRSIEFLEVGWGALTNDVIQYINQNVDFFVIAGGGYIFVNGDGSPGAMLADSFTLSQLRCPVIAIGIGLNRLMHETPIPLSNLPLATREKLNQLSRVCQKISVRDQDTAEIFARYGDKEVVVTGDPVLYFSDREPLVPRSGATIDIGINLAAHGWRAYSVLGPILPDIISSLINLQKQGNVALSYFVHHDFERPIVKYLKQSGLRLNVIETSARGLVDAYTKVDFVLNQMLHSCIFSANAGVPFLNLAYDRKSLAFCSLLEIPECVVEHSQVTSALLRERIDLLLKRRVKLCQTILTNRARLRAENQTFLRQIVEQVAKD